MATYTIFLYIIAISKLAYIFTASAAATPSTTEDGLNELATVSYPTFSQKQALTDVAQFDRENNADPIISIEPEGIYEDLDYPGWSLVVTDTLGSDSDIPLLVPNTPPNCIAYAVLDAATIDQGAPYLTAVYEESSIASFNFYSFFFGCALGTEETVVGVPQSCNLTVTGFNAQGKQVAQQAFAFVSNEGLNQQMVEANLKGFEGLQNAVFTTQASDTDLVATLADTFNYTVFGD